MTEKEFLPDGCYI